VCEKYLISKWERGELSGIETRTIIFSIRPFFFLHKLQFITLTTSLQYSKAYCLTLLMSNPLKNIVDRCGCQNQF
jgi:hypothetical protein